ncbi:MAG: efflux RND transporter periplasmic adaptor subunit [Bacteroidales bacterium]|nr:efflux RND transporter periplasmic adaptor subunit [Bacteroidales bacterium]MDT8430581.1 efflux RND transporter periplasmic adaptor subunit [Bacteroidales bacterium]
MMKYTVPLVIFLLLPASCNRPREQEVQEEDTLRVTGMRPHYIHYREPVRSTGILSTRTEIKMSFKTGGIVQHVHVRDGQFVEKGTVLASLDLSEINARASQASTATEKAMRDFRRASNLYFDSVVTLETLQNARTALELAQSEEKIADFNLKHSRIVAPTAGRVQKVLTENGEMIAPGQPAILFATTGNDWVVRIPLPDKDIVKFTPGDSASITIDAFPSDQFAASVLEVGSFADPFTGTFEVELLLSDTHPAFRTGFVARAELYPSYVISGYWVPMTALHDLEERRGKIFVLDSTQAVEREITTGPIYKEGIIVTSGIEGTEVVIEEGSAFLQNGQQVRINIED